MKVFFRADASVHIGAGHVSRCLALADALRARGAEVTFIHRLHPGHVADWTRARGYDVVELTPPPDPTPPVDDEDYAAWLGVSEAEDADETLAVVGGAGADCVVVDHYGLGRAWEEAVAARTDFLVAIDDLADREHRCSVLLDQNYFRDPASRYDGLVPEDALRLLGPRFALLAREYARARPFVLPRRGPVSRVLVFYGGGEPGTETLRALRVLSTKPFAHLGVDVIVGAGCPARGEVEALVRERPGTTLHGFRPTLVDLMIRADVVLGAGGTTSWERCALALPAVVTTVGRNQEPFNRDLGLDGVIAHLGPSGRVTDEQVAEALGRLLADAAALEGMSRRAHRVTDGRGAQRVAEALMPTPPSRLVPRAALSEDDRVFLRSDGDPSRVRDEVTRDREGPEDPHRSGWAIVTPDDLPLGWGDVQVRDGVGRVRWVTDDILGAPTLGRRVLDRTVLAAHDAGIRLPLRASGADRGLRITLLSDGGSWMKQWIPALAADLMSEGHSVRWIARVSELEEGDIALFLSLGQIVRPDALARHRHNLVVHASDLPKGRGWSPLTWEVLDGADHVTVTLLEAVDAVDAGPIYDQVRLELDGGELLAELRHRLAGATIDLCRRFVRGFPESATRSREQEGEATYYPRRRPGDSEFDPHRPLADQFDLLRIADDERYPAFFRLRGREYTLHVRLREQGAGPAS